MSLLLVAQPLGLAQPDAVDDRRVVQLVGDDRVLRAEQRLEEPAVGVEARRVEDRRRRCRGTSARLRSSCLCRILRAADEPHRGQPEAPVVERLRGGRDDRRVVGQAEVVVRAEVERLRRDASSRGPPAAEVSSRSCFQRPAYRISWRVRSRSSRVAVSMVTTVRWRYAADPAGVHRRHRRAQQRLRRGGGATSTPPWSSARAGRSATWCTT